MLLTNPASFFILAAVIIEARMFNVIYQWLASAIPGCSLVILMEIGFIDTKEKRFHPWHWMWTRPVWLMGANHKSKQTCPRQIKWNSLVGLIKLMGLVENKEYAIDRCNIALQMFSPFSSDMSHLPIRPHWQPDKWNQARNESGYFKQTTRLYCQPMIHKIIDGLYTIYTDNISHV